MLAIRPEEYTARRAALAACLDERGLAGAVLFDPHHVSYYTGFAFIPTERPIAFALAADGRGGMLVPRLEVEHAQANAAVQEVAHYDEYPGDRPPLAALAELLDALGVRGAIGADQDGYPWVFGYRGPSLGDVVGAEVRRVADAVEDQMAIKSKAELALLRESCKWGNLAHTLLQRYTQPGASETEVEQPRLDPRRPTRCWTRSARSTAARASGSSASVRRLPRPDRPQRRDSARAAEQHRLPGGRRARDRRDRARLGLPLGAGAHDGDRSAERRAKAAVRAHGRIAGSRRRNDPAGGSLRRGRQAPCAPTTSEHGLWESWRHHVGHAIGLRYHEGPFLDRGDATEIRPGMVFTVEPGLYAPAIGGFRHSDTVAVTEDGVEWLTYYPRDLESLTLPS